MLSSYAEMTAASVSRLMELREIIELHSKFVDRRAVPRLRRTDRAALDNAVAGVDLMLGWFQWPSGATSFHATSVDAR